VQVGDARYAVLPVWNSTIGRIVPAWEALAQPDDDSPLSVRAVGEITIPIRHYLLCRPGVRPEAITGVMGHPAALGQCERMIADRRLRPLPAEDSAGAARALAAATDGATMRVPGSDAIVDPRVTATIAPVAAAARYHLAVVACAVQDQPDNRTSFLVVEAGAGITESRLTVHDA
jgi:prephenate dehydratase